MSKILKIVIPILLFSHLIFIFLPFVSFDDPHKMMNEALMIKSIFVSNPGKSVFGVSNTELGGVIILIMVFLLLPLVLNLIAGIVFCVKLSHREFVIPTALIFDSFCIYLVELILFIALGQAGLGFILHFLFSLFAEIISFTWTMAVRSKEANRI